MQWRKCKDKEMNWKRILDNNRIQRCQNSNIHKELSRKLLSQVEHQLDDVFPVPTQSENANCDRYLFHHQFLNYLILPRPVCCNVLNFNKRKVQTTSPQSYKDTKNHLYIFFFLQACMAQIVIPICLPLKYKTRSTHLFDETSERAHVASTCVAMKAFPSSTSLHLITHQHFMIYSLHQQTNFYSFISFDTVLLQTRENNSETDTGCVLNGAAKMIQHVFLAE